MNFEDMTVIPTDSLQLFIHTEMKYQCLAASVVLYFAYNTHNTAL